MAKLVQMIALTLFTVNSPTTGAILHGDDREQADVRARYPLVSESDAAFLEKNKYAERYDGKVPSEDGTEELSVGEYAARETEGVSEADQSVDQSTALDTRATTAFEAPVETLAGQGGVNTIVVAGDEAPTGGGGSTGSTDTGSTGKSLSSMTKAELEKTAADEGVDLSSATNNDQRVDLIQKARDAKAS